MANLWSGRFEKEMDEIVEEFNASIDLDKRFYEVDIQGSKAHVKMLAKQNIIEENEKEEILKGLEEVRNDIEEGRVDFSYKNEDIHMSIERLLIEKIGDVGKKLHTARSRNDQIALDTRLFMKNEVDNLINELALLEEVLLKKAEEYKNYIMIGYTHLQHAQPVSIGFYLMAYFQMFKRDIERFVDLQERIDYNPLGSGALAGTTIDIDREHTTKLLGFKKTTENAMDSVSDKDFILEFLNNCSIAMMHLSRFSEEIIIWNSQEFNYIDIDDSFCTGSSIMPQKKNPDIAELIRGKTGRIYGNLMSLMTTMKGTPLAYNKDFQEDKRVLFDSLDTLMTSLRVFSKMMLNIKFNTEIIKENTKKGFLAATDIAEHMVKLKIPFREAHEIVGNMVKYCEKKEIGLENLKEEDYPEISDKITKDMIPDLSPESCVERRKSFGGTSIKEVERQIELGKEFIKEI